MYFLSGFDPRGSSFYYRLFVEQLQSYGSRTGRQFSVGRRRGQADPLLSSWEVNEHDKPILEVCFLHWDDIIRENWLSNPLSIVSQGLRFSLWCISGGFLRTLRLCPTVALCGIYPLLFWLVCGLLVAASNSLILSVYPGWLGCIASIGVTVMLIPLCWNLAERQGVTWLFRSILFTHRLGQSRDYLLRPRLKLLAQRILHQEEQNSAPSVLIVGHSSGSFVMSMLAAELKRTPGFGFGSLQASKFSLLSLGQNFANLGIHSNASAFHDDLMLLAKQPRLPWRDFSSRDDYLCFAGVDPYTCCDSSEDHSGYPELRLVRLSQRLGIDNWFALINKQFPLHFQYLHASTDAKSGGFDYYDELLADLAHD